MSVKRPLIPIVNDAGQFLGMGDPLSQDGRDSTWRGPWYVTAHELPTVYAPQDTADEPGALGAYRDNAPQTPWERIPPSIEVVLCLALTVGAIACVWGGWELFRWLVRLALK